MGLDESVFNVVVIKGITTVTVSREAYKLVEFLAIEYLLQCTPDASMEIDEDFFDRELMNGLLFTRKESGKLQVKVVPNEVVG